MSDAQSRRRIRAQASDMDPSVMRFVLDDAIAADRTQRFDGPEGGPLAAALFALGDVASVEVSGATIWVKKADQADWATLKPAIAAAIRQVLDQTDAPLTARDADQPAADSPADPDAALLQDVENLLERQVNPSVAGHGGHIGVERVAGGIVYLRMSGGCQGCAASSATLRQGVERMLRAALPQIEEIVDVTDHALGSNPFYERKDGVSPVFNKPIPSDVIGWEDEQITVDPEYLAPRLGLTPQTLREGLRSGAVSGVTEIGQAADAGKTRIIIRSAHRAWAAEITADGAAREIPPPRRVDTAASKEQDLPTRVRAHLNSLPPGQIPIPYGALARALGLWMPGSVRKITAALETTMREDAAAGRPFVAARAVSRGGSGLPGKGFFDLARALGRGPQEDESEQAFHTRELRLVGEVPGGASTASDMSPGLHA